MRAIDADKLFVGLVDEYDVPVEDEDPFETTIAELKEYIKEEPTIEIQKESEWIPVDDEYRECKLCRNQEAVWLAREYKFCPFCGAKMKKMNGEKEVDEELLNAIKMLIHKVCE